MHAVCPCRWRRSFRPAGEIPSRSVPAKPADPTKSVPSDSLIIFAKKKKSFKIKNGLVLVFKWSLKFCFLSHFGPSPRIYFKIL